MESVQIGEKQIGPGHPAYVIAEAGVNHKGSLEAARRMIDEAKRAGADAIKFQTYKADKLVTRNAPRYWDDPEATGTQYAVFKRSDQFEEDDYRVLFEHARAVGITWLSTAFDLDAVRFLDDMGMQAFKVASPDLTNYPLLKAVAKTGKPVILSTGASTLSEVHASVDFLRLNGCHDVILLYAVLNYPTANQDAHLRRIQTLQAKFPAIPVGYSDHTIPDNSVSVPLAAVVMGAYVIQKGFTLNRALPGDDHLWSVDPVLMARMVQSIRLVEQALGDPNFGVQTGEEEARRLGRRSIVTARFIPMGSTISHDMLIMKRPGTGISPSEVKHLVGRIATVDIQPDTIINWDMVN
ncbi:MAG: N-acetylneuraminate synthase family protein [Anaerolineae bacterium]|nr:N-acetylneuraminate synthase family protein [Anaerolineae bacterium]